MNKYISVIFCDSCNFNKWVTFSKEILLVQFNTTKFQEKDLFI